MMAALLGELYSEVETAQTATEALRLAESARFDLYVIDNHFPDGSGVELCRQIRGFDGRTPLVVYSGNFDQGRLRRGVTGERTSLCGQASSR